MALWGQVRLCIAVLELQICSFNTSRFSLDPIRSIEDTTRAEITAQAIVSECLLLLANKLAREDSFSASHQVVQDVLGKWQRLKPLSGASVSRISAD